MLLTLYIFFVRVDIATHFTPIEENVSLTSDERCCHVVVRMCNVQRDRRYAVVLPCACAMCGMAGFMLSCCQAHILCTASISLALSVGDIFFLVLLSVRRL